MSCVSHGMPYSDKYDYVYFAKSNGGVFWGKNKILALIKNPFNICKFTFV